MEYRSWVISQQRDVVLFVESRGSTQIGREVFLVGIVMILRLSIGGKRRRCIAIPSTRWWYRGQRIELRACHRIWSRSSHSPKRIINRLDGIKAAFVKLKWSRPTIDSSFRILMRLPSHHGHFSFTSKSWIVDSGTLFDTTIIHGLKFGNQCLQ